MTLWCRNIHVCGRLWAIMHFDDPKPERDTKQRLASYCNMDLKQVSDWFTNWRARHWKPCVKKLAVELQQHDGGTTASD